jgi:hypothetical protein
MRAKASMLAGVLMNPGNKGERPERPLPRAAWTKKTQLESWAFYESWCR